MLYGNVRWADVIQVWSTNESSRIEKVVETENKKLEHTEPWQTLMQGKGKSRGNRKGGSYKGMWR